MIYRNYIDQSLIEIVNQAIERACEELGIDAEVDQVLVYGSTLTTKESPGDLDIVVTFNHITSEFAEDFEYDKDKPGSEEEQFEEFLTDKLHTFLHGGYTGEGFIPEINGKKIDLNVSPELPYFIFENEDLGLDINEFVADQILLRQLSKQASEPEFTSIQAINTYKTVLNGLRAGQLLHAYSRDLLCEEFVTDRINCGWLDGGCLIFAKAIQKMIPDSKLVGTINAAGRYDHVAVEVYSPKHGVNLYIDADGIATENDMLDKMAIAEMSPNTHIEDFDRSTKFCVIPEDDELSELVYEYFEDLTFKEVLLEGLGVKSKNNMRPRRAQ